MQAFFDQFFLQKKSGENHCPSYCAKARFAYYYIVCTDIIICKNTIVLQAVLDSYVGINLHTQQNFFHFGKATLSRFCVTDVTMLLYQIY